MLELYRLIWSRTRPQQLVLIVLSIVTALLAIVPLELQRHIINGLAHDKETPRVLATLCGAYLAVVLTKRGLACLVNFQSAMLGEHIVRRLREWIYGRVGEITARPDPQQSQGTQPGTVITMISAEAETLGRFVGTSIQAPLLQVGTMLSVSGYMLVREPALGLIAIAVIIPQAIAFTLVQRRINTCIKDRTTVLREAGDMVVGEVSAGDRSGGSEQEILSSFGQIFDIRKRLNALKIGMKFFVAALNVLGRVSILFFGGLLVLEGQSEVGIVVAFLSGFGKVTQPTTKIITFFRNANSAVVQYNMLKGILGGLPQIIR